jgi:hypothetical protein
LQTARQNLLSLARYLASYPGRKNLIYFTSGTSGSNAFPDSTEFVRDAKGITDTLKLSRVAIYTIDASGLSPVGPGALQRLNGNGVPTGMDPGVDNRMHNGAQMQDMATATGGRAYYNVNGFKDIVAEIVNTGTHYYTLSYNPTNANWNGAFRTIKVHTTYQPDHANVLLKAGEMLLGQDPWLLYRTGYYARDHNPGKTPGAPVPSARPTSSRTLISYSPKGDPGGPGHSLLPKPSAMDIAMRLAAAPPFQIHFTATFAPSDVVQKIKPNTPWPRNNFLADPWRSGPFRQYSIHYWITPNQLQFSSADALSYHDTIRLITLVYTDDGTLVNSIATTSDFFLNPDQYARALRQGLVDDQTIAIPVNGNFFLRTGVEEMTTDRIGALEVPVESIKLSPPVASRAKSN